VSAHAKIGPSAFERISLCPASIRLAQGLPERPAGTAAIAGTLLHEVFERVLLGGDGLFEDELEALEHLDFGADYSRRLLDGAVSAARSVMEPFGIDEFLTETRVQCGRDEGPSSAMWGTADLIGANEKTRVLLVGDAKFGSGVVPAEFNYQMLSYAVGARRIISFEPQKVVLAIFQPAVLKATPKVWVTDNSMLDQFEDHIEEVCTLVESPDTQPTPGATQCKWCPARPACPALK